MTDLRVSLLKGALAGQGFTDSHRESTMDLHCDLFDPEDLDPSPCTTIASAETSSELYFSPVSAVARFD